jgi:hypothetical protein
MYIPYIFFNVYMFYICVTLSVPGMEGWNSKIGAKCHWRIWYLVCGSLLEQTMFTLGTTMGVQTYNTYQYASFCWCCWSFSAVVFTRNSVFFTQTYWQSRKFSVSSVFSPRISTSFDISFLTTNGHFFVSVR